MNTPIGQPIDKTITEMLSPEALLNYNDAKSGGLGIKANTEQAAPMPASFSENDKVKAAAQAAGTTPQAMWNNMTPEQRNSFNGE